MANLTSQQLTTLGNNFLDFAQAVGNYRMENNDTLSSPQNQQLKDLHGALLDHADKLFTTAAILVMDDIQTSLNTINDVTTQINVTYHTLQKIQKAIDVAAAGVTLAAAIFSENPQAIAGAITGLVNTWSEEYQL